MLKYATIVLVGLFGLGFGFLCSALAEETKVDPKLIPLSGGKTRGALSGYYFGNDWVTWQEAKSECLKSGLKLATLDTKVKQTAFERYLDASYFSELYGWEGYAWIGGTDKRSTTGGVGIYRFYWSPRDDVDVQAMSFRNFGSEPTAPIGYGCVTISNENSATKFGRWFVQNCDALNMYFCETVNN